MKATKRKTKKKGRKGNLKMKILRVFEGI